MHKWINTGIIGGSCKNQFAVAKSVRQSQRHVVSCKIINHNLGTAFAFQFVCQDFNCLFGMTINRSVSDHNSFFFRGIGGPFVIKTDIMAKILGKNRAVKRTDHLDIQSCGNLQQRLNLWAIFANNPNKISSCFVIPVFIHIQGTEFAKAVC